MSAPTFSPARHSLHLSTDGAATLVAGGEKFWSLPAAELEKFAAGWLISEFECAADWPMWEMHPRGDEFVYLLSGQVTMLLEIGAGQEAVELEISQAFVIPQGVWHSARVQGPARMLFVTRGAGTAHRSA